MFVSTTLSFIVPHLVIISGIDLAKFDISARPAASTASAKFLSLYQKRQYLLNLHVTNRTKYLTNNFLAVYPTVSAIFNHDSIQNDYLKRPHGLRHLNLVIFENPLRFSNYLQQPTNINSEDVILFLVRPPAFKLLERKHAAMLPNLQKSGRVIVVVIADKVNKIYTMCFFCGKKSGALILLETLSNGSLAKESPLLFASDYKNFNGHLLNVAYIDYFPYIYCRKKIIENKQTICKKAFGIEVNLLITISKALNFKFQLIESTNESYHNLFAGLLKQKYDFAIGGLSMSVKRRQFLQFSDLHKFEDLALIFYYKEPFLLTVKRVSYVTFLTRQTFYIISTATTIFIYFINKYLAKVKVSCIKITEIMFHIGSDRPVNLEPILPHIFKGSVAISLCMCCVYAMVSNILYKSSLVSMLIAQPVPEIKIKNLIKENYKFVTDRLIAELHFPMLESELSMEDVMVVNYNACRMFEEILKNKAVILGETSRNVLHVVVHCQKYFAGKFPEGLIIQKFGVTPFAWPFRVGAPFVDSFNTYHKLIFQSGLRKMWWQDILLQESLHKYFYLFSPSVDTTVRLNGFLTQLIIYCFCISCTVLVLLMEIVIDKMKQ